MNSYLKGAIGATIAVAVLYFLYVAVMDHIVLGQVAQWVIANQAKIAKLQ